MDNVRLVAHFNPWGVCVEKCTFPGLGVADTGTQPPQNRRFDIEIRALGMGIAATFPLTRFLTNCCPPSLPPSREKRAAAPLREWNVHAAPTATGHCDCWGNKPHKPKLFNGEFRGSAHGAGKQGVRKPFLFFCRARACERPAKQKHNPPVCQPRVRSPQNIWC